MNNIYPLPINARHRYPLHVRMNNDPKRNEMTILITKANYDRINQLMNDAIKDDKDSFMFNEKKFLVPYALNLLVYMKSKLK